ncbi:hypothetical protein NDU88_003064 [Pleurodeles waltl]|uniref:Uncharacterized protein n=1 Tax=Pleurodeles waltl TaxID=8319 RepID=A0AAV7T4D2_PLEWA|nr:hypothetical protein NDU88_003064 [Pleurodeles waltl]
MIIRRFWEAIIRSPDPKLFLAAVVGYGKPHQVKGCVCTLHGAAPDLRLSPGSLRVSSTLPGPNGTPGGGETAAAALLSPPPGCPGSIPQARSTSQTGAAAPPGRRPRTGVQGRLRSLRAFFLVRAAPAPQPMGVRSRSTGPDTLMTFAAPLARSGHAKRSRRSSLSPAGQAQPRPPSCRSGRSGRSDGTGSEILDRSSRQAPQGSEGHEDVWNGVLHSARPH